MFANDECLAPLNDELSLRDCCSLKEDIVQVIRDLIVEKNTTSIVLSETRFINKCEFKFYYNYNGVFLAIINTFLETLTPKDRKLVENAIKFEENVTLTN